MHVGIDTEGDADEEKEEEEDRMARDERENIVFLWSFLFVWVLLKKVGYDILLRKKTRR